MGLDISVNTMLRLLAPLKKMLEEC